MPPAPELSSVCCLNQPFSGYLKAAGDAVAAEEKVTWEQKFKYWKLEAAVGPREMLEAEVKRCFTERTVPD